MCRQSSLAAQPNAGDTGSILVVENDRYMREAIAGVLEQRGYANVVALAMPAAINWLQANQPLLIIADLEFPRADSAVLAAASECSGGGVAPVVLITDRPDAQRSARHVGVVGQLTKPFSASDLINALPAAG